MCSHPAIPKFRPPRTDEPARTLFRAFPGCIRNPSQDRAMQPVHPKKECPTMQLANIELGKLCVSKANMRYGRKAPDVSDILPSIRARGVLVPLLVRPGPVPSAVAGGKIGRASCRARVGQAV